MRLPKIFLAILTCQPAFAVVPTPPRALTDPRSIESPVMPNAGPIPLGHLDAVRTAPGFGGVASGAVWAADGRSVVVSMNLTGRFNLWRIPIDGGFPVQLTASDDRQFPIAALKDGRVLFVQDKGGDEAWDIYSVPISGGTVTNLTNTADRAEVAGRVSPDERSVTLTIREKASPLRELGALDLATREVRQLTRGSDPARWWIGQAWSPDASRIYANYFSAAESTVFEVDARTGVMRRLQSTRPSSFESVADVAHDGRLAITALDEQGRKRAGIMNPATGSVKWLRPAAWDRIAASFSPNGRWLLVQTDGDGRSELSIADAETLKERPVRFAGGTAAIWMNVRSPSPWHPASGSFLMLHEAGNAPSDIWQVSVSGMPERRLTNLAVAGLDARSLPPSRVVTFRSSDGTLISGLLTVPPNLRRDGSHPAVVIPHGGPTGRSTDAFSPIATALASRGFFVIRPNFRGSTGYGLAFQNANRRDLGGGDLEDVVAAANFLVDTGYVDRRRLGINGGSYGGFLTLMALGKRPGVFAAAVAERPVLDWLSMAQPGMLQGYAIDIAGDPNDKALYDKQSPKTYLKNIKLPLLVLQGEGDIRTPRSQTDELARMIRKQGGIVETVYYSGEGHGNAKVENQRDTRERIVAWFEKHLKNASGR